MNRSKSKVSNKMIFWIVFGIVLALALVYMFVVIYFYYISSTNIPLKLALWPFNSDKAIGEMYLDATVQVDFQLQDAESGETTQKSIVGVNVKEEGVIITLFSDIRHCKEGSEITINTNNGVFSGDLIYGDINYNLAVLKCKNKSGKSGRIKIPYVNIASEGEMSDYDDVFVISSPMEKNNVKQGYLLGNAKYVHEEQISYLNTLGIDYVLKDCYVFAFTGQADNENFTSGNIFDRRGNLFGMSIKYSIDEGGFVFVPAYHINNFMQSALSSYYSDKTKPYQNAMIENMKVVDLYDMEAHTYESSIMGGNKNGYYFGETGGWKEYTAEIQKFLNNKVESVFLVEDFVLNDEIILEKNHVVNSIKISGTTYKIYDKLNFVDVLYKTRAGQKITLNYTTVYDTETVLSKEFVL